MERKRLNVMEDSLDQSENSEDVNTQARSLTNVQNLSNNSTTMISEEVTTTKSFRTGKALKEPEESIAKPNPQEEEEEIDVQTTTPRHPITAAVYAETPTIKITILPQDGNDIRDYDARNLRYFNGPNRTRIRGKINSETTTESINGTNDNLKKYSNTLYRLRNRVTTPASIKISKESFSEEHSQLSSTTLKAVENELDAEADESSDKAIRRPYAGINRFRIRTTTTTEIPITSSNKNEEIELETEGEFEENIDKTTRRTYSGINRTRIRTTTTTENPAITKAVENEIEAEGEENFVKTTRRPYAAINRTRIRTSTTTENPVISKTVENESKAEGDSGGETNFDKTTRRPYIGINQIRTRTTTTKENDTTSKTVENDIKGEGYGYESLDKTTRRSYAGFMRTRQSTTTTTTGSPINEETNIEATTKRSYNSISRFRDRLTTTRPETGNGQAVTKDQENMETVKISNIESLTVNKDKNETETTLLDDAVTTSVAPETTNSNETSVEASNDLLAYIGSGKVKTENKFLPDELTTIKTLNESEEELTADIDDDDGNKDSVETTTTSEKESTTRRLNESEEELTADIDDDDNNKDSVETTTTSEKESTTRRRVLIRKRLRTTTPQTNANHEDENDGLSTTESATFSFPKRKQVIIRRIPTTQAPKSDTTSENSVKEEESTTRRNIVTLNRNRFRTTTTALTPQLQNNEDVGNEKDTETTTETRVVGQSNRHRALTTSALENSISSKSENIKETTVGNKRTFARPYRIRTTTESVFNNEETTESDVADVNTRRSITRQYSLRTTTDTPTTQKGSTNEVKEAQLGITRRPFQRINRFRSTTLAATDSTTENTEANEIESTTRRTFRRQNTESSETSVPSAESDKIKKAFGRLNRFGITTTRPDLEKGDDEQEDTTTTRRPLNAFNRRQRPTIAPRKPTAPTRKLPSFNRALYNRNEASNDDGLEYEEDEDYEDEKLPRIASVSRNQQLSSVLPTRRQFLPKRFNLQNEENLSGETENESYEEDDVSAEHLKSTTERSYALQNLRNRVRVSQTRTELEENGVVNNRLKELISNRQTSTEKPTTNSDKDSDDRYDNENIDENEDVDTKTISITNKSNQKNTFINKSVASLLANRVSTNRSSTVANYYSRTNTNANLNANKTLSTLGTIGSNVEDENEHDMKNYHDDVDEVKELDEVSSKVKGIDVNSKRRFQKYQFNRTRTALVTTTEAGRNDENETGIADQVNKLIDEQDEEDNENEKEDEKGDNEEVTESTTSPATAPKRIRVLKHRRPIGVGNANSTAIINQAILVNNSDSNNISNLSATNETNTVTVTSNLHSETNVNGTTQTEIPPQNADTTPTKRFRKIVRKLIRPVTTTTEYVTEDIDVETTTPTASSTTNGNTVLPTFRRRFKGSRVGFNRSINTTTQLQKVDSADTERVQKEGLNTLTKIKPRFGLRNDGITTVKPTIRSSKFNTALRSRYGARGSSTTTKANANEDEEEDEDEEIDESEDADEASDNTTTPKNRFSALPRPFSPRSGTTTTESTVNVEDETLVITTRRPFIFTRPSSTAKTTNASDEIDDEELIAEVDDEEHENQDTEKNVDLQKIRDKVKIEQTKENKDNGIINTRLKKVLVLRKNGTVSSTETLATNLNETTNDQAEDALQKIRNKVKFEQTKVEQDLGVVNARLKKLLEERSKVINETTPYVVAKDEADSAEKDTDGLDLQKIRDKVKIQQAKVDEDRGVISTRLKQILTDKKNSARESANNTDIEEKNEDSSELNNDTNLTTQPRPFSPRRPFIPGSRVQATQSTTEATVANEGTGSTNKTTTSGFRPTFRKKLVAKRPYQPVRLNISTTVAPTLPSRSPRKYLRPKNGPSRFAPFNAGNRNNGEGFTRTDPRGSRLPGTSRFKSEDRGHGGDSQEDDEDDEYESEENETEANAESSSTPTIPIVSIAPISRPPGLFNRPLDTLLKKPTETLKEDKDKSGEDKDNESEEDEDEDDEEAKEDEDEEHDALDEVKQEGQNNENKPKLNVTTTYRNKDNRAPPGARTALLPTLQIKQGNRLQQNIPNRLNSGGFSGRYGTPQFGRLTTTRPRVVNRPSVAGLTIRPVALDFERTTPALPTKPAPFIPTNTRSYERKYVGSSTETPEINNDNSLIEELNIEALNARNKKIFDINSKKHTTLKPKVSPPTPSPTDDSQNTRQNTQNENDDGYTATNAVGEQPGYATTTSRTPLTNTANLYINDNVISSQDNEAATGRSSTQQTPTTTLVHVFTLTDDEQTQRPPSESGNQLMPRILSERVRPKHKIVEVNRIVEINSKEDKLRRKSKANQEFLKQIGTSQLKVESLPHVEQLGEISVVKYVHLVDGSDISIDGHSTVADYTPTDPTVPRNLAAVRNSIPDNTMREYAQLNEGPHYVATTEGAGVRATLQERYGKALIPEVIREAVEASTISLEGLFDNARKGKEINSIDDNTYAVNGLNVDFSTPNPVYLRETSEKPNLELNLSEQQIVSYIESSKTIEATTIAAENNAFTLSPAELKQETTDVKPANLEQIKSDTTATTESASKATTIAAALFPTYVRPIVPLLRPESNESSPLVISIANLDKVILSKVERAQKDAKYKEAIESNTQQFIYTVPKQNETQSTVNEIADSKSAFSSRHASVVEAPTNLIVDLAQQKHEQNEGITKLVTASVGSINSANGAGSDNHKHTNANKIITSSNSVSSVNSASNSNVSSSSSSSSNISEQVSYRTETHVVHKKKSRSHQSKSRKLKNLNNKRTTTTVPEINTVSVATTIATKLPVESPASAHVDEGYETTTSLAV